MSLLKSLASSDPRVASEYEREFSCSCPHTSCSLRRITGRTSRWTPRRGGASIWFRLMPLFWLAEDKDLEDKLRAARHPHIMALTGARVSGLAAGRTGSTHVYRMPRPCCLMNWIR